MDNKQYQNLQTKEEILKECSARVINILTNNCACTLVDFQFNNNALQKLKALAIEDLSAGYVSTDDTISAFLWKPIYMARIHRLLPTTLFTFVRGVDARILLDILAT